MQEVLDVYQVRDLGHVVSESMLVREVIANRRSVPDSLVLLAVFDLANECARDELFAWCNHPERVWVDVDLVIDNLVYASGRYRNNVVPFTFLLE